MKRDNYEDIINLPPPKSQNHTRMPREDRAAQFSPFAALTGYEEVIKEEARVTEAKIRLDIDSKIGLDKKLQELKASGSSTKKLTICYFEADKAKEGGRYIQKQSIIKRIDEIKKLIILEDGSIIKAEDIYSLDY